MAEGQKNCFFKRALGAVSATFLPQKNEAKMQRRVTVMFSCVLVFALVFTAAAYGGFAKESISRSRNEELGNIIRQNQSGDYSKELKSLERVNPDVKYGLRVNVGNICLPVAVSESDYYSTHNYDKQLTRHGALYTSPLEKGKNTVIYGNNMADGSMFGRLSELRNPKTFSENPYIEFITGKKSEMYIIFSVMILADDPKDDNGRGFDVTKGSFESFADYTAWIDEALSRSVINTEVKPQRDDKIICLMTDDDAFSGARLAVMAFKINNGTNISHIDEASVNIQARYPKIWYEKNGYEYPNHF